MKNLILIVLSLFVLTGCDLKEKKFTVPPADTVVDTSGTLKPEEINELKSLISDFEKKTGGCEFAVCVVDSMYGLTREEAAMKVAEAWKVGKKDKDNGVVFFLAMKERQFHMLVGYGLEGQLNDGKVGEICDLVVPKFKSGNWKDGIEVAIKSTGSVLSGEKLEANKEESKQVPLWLWIVVGAIGFIIIIDLVRNGEDSFVACIFLSSGSSGSGGSSFGGRGGFGGGSFGGGGAGRGF